MKLRLNRTAWNLLRRLGVQGLSIIEFDDTVGPIPKFVYSRNSRLIRRILRDRIFSSKVSILAKYACEARLADDSRIIIETFESIGNRVKTNYIVAQISENAKYTKVRNILKTLKRKLEGCKEIRKDIVEDCLISIA